MKILSVHAENFASYETLDFTFEDDNVTLIQGANGSGKSTLCDVIPWVLFGVTAKNGKADDVLSWHGGDVFVFANIEVYGSIHTISRKRGAKGNDLYILEHQVWENPKRGKDLQDTQKLINNILGMDAELYLACAYSHEFSQTAQFFQTNAKTRREITERMVDLSLPIKLQEEIKTHAKEVEKELKENEVAIKHEKYNRLVYKEQLKVATQRNDTWLEDQKTRKEKLKASRPKFSEDLGLREKINNINEEISLQKAVCEHCGTKLDTVEMKELKARLSALQAQEVDYKLKLQRSESIDMQLEELSKAENSYKEDIIKYTKRLEVQQYVITSLSAAEETTKEKKLQLDLLSDAVMVLRAELIENTVKDLESRTNQLIYDHFEGVIKVEFSVSSNDKLDVQIQKDSNECSYMQLSKGQQKILKLCFGVAVMNIASEHNALSFSQLFFDEALDGMDDTNKLKAVRLLETLAINNGSVYLVEHSETIKAHIDQKYSVELVDGKSQFSKT